MVVFRDLSPEAGELAHFMSAYRTEKKSKLANNPYEHSWEYREMNKMFRYPEKPITDAGMKGMIAGRAVGDLKALCGPEVNSRSGYYSPNGLFRNAVRALYQLGNLHTSKTVAPLVDRALRSIEGTSDKFEYGMSKHMAQMMLSDKV